MQPPVGFRNTEINDRQIRGRRPDPGKFESQWKGLYDSLSQYFSVEILCDPFEYPTVSRCPDSCFPANIGLVTGHHSILLGRFKEKIRRLEERLSVQAFISRGWNTEHFPHPHVFEGVGEAMFLRAGMVFFGYGYRATARSFREFQDLFPEAEVIPLHLQNPKMYHLDVCFAHFIRGREDFFIYHPGAFLPDGLRKIRDVSNRLRATLVPVGEKDALRFACNAFCLGNEVFMPSGTGLAQRLRRDYGFSVHEFDVSEFIECGGGGVACMVLRGYLPYLR